ncbi:hypothetical protein FIBSPDRAFT_218867 [Athelia psychrophila]|uniref:Uncharacterized protein n=1 Tax=Athelia psychrophila TaxID=1759441 RepID=A0A165ZAC2_9AGAM|nr:hypothetical protein FIBSPDRAFT_218867 [Fibularhizoctonia sp. CBS 109695]
MRYNRRAWLAVKNNRPAGEPAMAVGEEVSLGVTLSNSDPERSPAKRTRPSAEDLAGISSANDAHYRA